MNIPEKILSTLTDEQKKKVEAAQSPEELLAIAEKTGYELSEEQLNAVTESSWCEHYCAGYCPSFCREDSASGDRLRYGDCPALCFKHQ